MGWFSSGVQPPKPSNGQIEQRSHQQLQTNSDISQTLNQIDDHPAIKQVSENHEERVKDFVAAKPNNMFIIDGEKDTDDSIICTDNGAGGKTCLKLGISSIKLFTTMQRMEYFCSLPDNIDSTYFECRKIK